MPSSTEVTTVTPVKSATGRDWGWRRPPSLRRVLLERVLLVAAIQVLLTLAVAKFQLFPQIESLQVSLNETLAANISRSAAQALTRPKLAVRAALTQFANPATTPAVRRALMKQLVDGYTATESVYLLNPLGIVAEVAFADLPGTKIRGGDRLSLDLSQSTMYRSRDKSDVGISPIFLSAISDQPMIAVTGPLADGGLLVVELSLTRLAHDQSEIREGSDVEILIVDGSGQIISDRGGAKARQSGQLPIEVLRQLETGGAATVTLDEKQWFASIAKIAVAGLDWHVIVMRPEALVYRPVTAIVMVTIVTTGLLLLFSLVLLMLAARTLTGATEALSKDARALEAGGSPAPRNFGVQELSELDSSLRSMAHTLTQRELLLKQANEVLEVRVQERTHHLQSANTELGLALGRLHATQAELVQAGKMAALGSMVAGVAHELNTPVGNARLVATSLMVRAERLQTLVASGQISRKELTQNVTDFSEGATIIDKNLERAADLVQSFKQVAVDQTSNRRRTFFMAEVIRENQLLLSPRLNKAGVTLSVECPATIEMSGYPGDLGQVLSNLIENAMLHGYSDRHGGTIDIQVEEPDETRVRVQVRDHGCGIADEALGRIFDPFYTSRMGQGGSGLGLSIVYAMVTQSLGGRISVESALGKGTTFTLELPVNVPEPTPREGSAA